MVKNETLSFAQFTLMVILFTMSVSATAQCPEIVNVSYNGNCVFLNWEDAPVPPPFDVVYNNQLYSYDTGDGETTPATYRKAADESCEFNDDGFTGVLEIDGLSCSYLGGAPDPEPLPVTLISFDGDIRHDHVSLHWVTAFEEQNEEFRVERSTYKQDWITIGSVDGNGNYDGIQNYEIKDYSPWTGMNFYRLVQIDHDGGESRSDVIALEVHGSFDGMSVSPNPASENFRINGIDNGDVVLYTLEGRMINKFDLSQRNDFSVEGLPSGVYLVRVQDKSGGSYTEKLFVR
jgi:hypothetical protein